MKAGLLTTGSGALIYLTSHDDYMDDVLIEKLKDKGISKFISYEVSVDEARRRYGGHFEKVIQDLHESDDLRILDYDGSRAFRMFSFEEMSNPFMHE